VDFLPAPIDEQRYEGSPVRSHHDHRIARHGGGKPSCYIQPAGGYSGHGYNSATPTEITMARKKTTPGPQQVQSDDGSQDIDPQSQIATKPGSSRKMSKTDAIRAAMAEGIESPGDGVDFIRKRFGLEMSKGHFSATKSKLKSAEDTKQSAPQAAPKAATKPQPVGDYQTPPEQPAGRDGNLLDALEQMKPLIAQYGPDHVKRMVDLLG